MSNVVERIIEEIENGEIEIEEGEGIIFTHPFGLLLQYDFADEHIYGFNR